MQTLVALLAGCLLYPPPDDPCREAREAQYEFLRSHGAENVEWNANGTVKHMKAAGIFLRSDIADLEAEDPAPQILEAIGPALLARGTEELRVRDRYRGPTPAELTFKLNQFIAGREVRWAYVNIVVLEQTNELKEVWAGFMPDRGLDHEPRLSPDEARAKAIPTIQETFDRWQGPTERDLLLSDDAPSDLLLS